jgi:hypothetical protein
LRLTGLILKLLLVAPGMLLPFLRHWYVRSAPVAVTEKLADWPAHLLIPAGWLVICGAALIVRLAAFDVRLPQEFVITTSYEPASPVDAGLIVKVAVVTPETFPPLASGDPFFRHWYDRLVPVAPTVKLASDPAQAV